MARTYPPQMWAALAVTDRAYLLRWGKVVNASAHEDDLRAVMDTYNALMGPVYQRWQEESAAAVALGDGDPF